MSNKAHTRFCHQEIETPRRVARVKDMLSFIDADCDRAKWRDIVWAVLSTGWSCAEELALEWSKSAPEAYEEAEFFSVINSYVQSIEKGHTLGTIYHFARLGGWDE